MTLIPAVDPDIGPSALAGARALIGVPLRRSQHNHLVSHPAINRWAKSIGDRNPLWLDPTYSAASVLGTTVAPPLWLYSVDDTAPSLKFPGLHVLYGGVHWEFRRWLTAGERVSAATRLLDVKEKHGRFCGPMVLQTFETVYSDGAGNPISRAESTIIRTLRNGAIQSGKYRDVHKYVFDPDEARAVEDAYDAEEVRGALPRYWDSLSPGDPIPPIVRGPLTSEEVIQFVCATRPTLGFKQFLRHRQRHPDTAFLDLGTGSWESWESSMVRDDVAQAFGFPAAHDAGIDRVSWVGNLLTNWMGDQGFLSSLRVVLIRPNIYGDVTWCRGKVEGLRREGGRHLADLSVWCENQRGQRTAEGEATVILTRRRTP